MPYQPSFIPGHTVRLPQIPGELPVALMPNGKHVLDYHHHSVVMNSRRKFAFFSASNIDGNTWDPIDRSGDFIKDDRMPEFQWGDELYAAIGGRGRKNDFDEGHLTSFQEVLWGDTDDMQQAGQDTFFFSNCVPQHSLLNRGAWKSLEQYVTKKGANNQDIKISVFTGPVFTAKDPFFIQTVEDKFIRIPVTFWKIIYYEGPGGLSAVGFMMNQERLLLDEGTVTHDKDEVELRDLEEVEEVFMSFPKATTYQVKVELIEKVTKLNFRLSGVQLPYQQDDSREIVYKRIEIVRERGFEPASFKEEPLDYKLEGLVL